MSSSSSMRQTTVVTSASATHPHFVLDPGASPLDDSLDALLEDLQSSVSRPGSSSAANHVNGPSMTGTTSSTSSRVVQRVVQRSGGNSPSVQYLQPANSTTVVSERASSPLPGPGEQRTVTSYKTYEYRFNEDGTPGHQTVSSRVVEGGGPPRRSTSETMGPPATSSTEMRHNLNELDNLLVGLHQAQQSTPHSTVVEHATAPGPPGSNTTSHITRTVRTYQFDNTYGTPNTPNNTYGTPNSVRRELQYPPSPKPERSSRAKSPPSSGGQLMRAPSPVRAPSPSRKVTTTVKTYTYEIPPGEAGPPQIGSPTVKTYSYQLPSDKPSPPTEDTVITYKYSSSPHNVPLVPRERPEPVAPIHEPLLKTTTTTYKYPSDPQPPPPPPNTYITYNTYTSNHSSNTSHHPPHTYGQLQREPPHRPFPTQAPTPPPSAEPPKRLEELMASFGDTDTVDIRKEHHVRPRPTPPPMQEYPEPPSPPPAVASTPPSPPAPMQEQRVRTKNIAGPPVYYPPGVEMFARKDEPVHAKMKEGASTPADSKGSGGGVAAVPVCLPLCCAMPCTIM